MQKITYFYAEGDNRPYSSEEEALKVEERNKEWREGLINNDPHVKLSKLKDDLDKAMYIHPATMATCTFSSLQVKAMVKVCQTFADVNKEYLNYY